MATQRSKLWGRFSTPRKRRTTLAVIGLVLLSSGLISLKAANRSYREHRRTLAEQVAADSPAALESPSSPAVAIPAAPIYALPFAAYVFIAALTNLVFGYFTAVMIGYRPKTALYY